MITLFIISLNRDARNMDMEDWLYPIDFSLFPSEMISGLEIREINEILYSNDVEKRLSSANEKSPPDFLAIEEKPSTSRFGKSLNNDDINTLNKEGQALNTIKRNKWAFEILEDWIKIRRIEVDVPNMTNEELSKMIGQFIHEARRSDWERY